jgi:hypothetical protein
MDAIDANGKPIKIDGLIGVEMKHYQAMEDSKGKISYRTVDLEQLKRNATLVKKDKLARVEYIFSNLDALNFNKIAFRQKSGFEQKDLGTKLKAFYVNVNDKQKVELIEVDLTK